MNPYLKENILNWISEFEGSDEAAQFSKKTRQACAYFLQELIMSVIDKSDDDVIEVTEKILGEELSGLANKYDITEEVNEQLPIYVGEFLISQEVQGRWGGGEALGFFAKTFSGRLGHQTAVRPGAKIGRNDPCPCGSGLKYKKCCFKG